MKRCLESCLGTVLIRTQWSQAKLPTKQGGLGFLSPRAEIGLENVHLADLAYVASKRKCLQTILDLYFAFPVQIDVGYEAQALQHVMRFLPRDAPGLQDPRMEIQQATATVHSKVIRFLMEQAAVVGQARLRTFAASGADGWLRARPALAQDLLLTNATFRDIVSMRLGVPCFEPGKACSFCHQNLDAFGHYVFHCMGHGHKQATHTVLKNAVFALALQAGATLVGACEPVTYSFPDKTCGCSGDGSPANPSIFLASFSAVGPGCSGYISFPVSYLGSGGTGNTGSSTAIGRT